MEYSQLGVVAVRSTKKNQVSVVITREEVRQVIALMRGTPQLVVKLLYGSGFRIMEAVRLRVQDIDYDYKQIAVRAGKERRDRVTTFLVTLIPLLQQHLERVRLLHGQDLAEGFGEVYLPYALVRKYPEAARQWGWQYIFPARQRATDPHSEVVRRHHIAPSVINKAIKEATRKLGLTKRISAHTFRHSFAMHLSPRYRHPNDPGATRSSGCSNHHDLYPCFAARRPWLNKSS